MKPPGRRPGVCPLEGGKKIAGGERIEPPVYCKSARAPGRQTSMNKNCLSPLRGLFVALSYRGLTPPAIFSTPFQGFTPYRNHLQHIKNTRLFSQRPSRASCRIATICNTSKTPGYFLNALPGLHAVSQPSAIHQKHPAIFSPPFQGFTPYRNHLQHIKNTRLFSQRP
jgi:hypothetical protein